VCWEVSGADILEDQSKVVIVVNRDRGYYSHFILSTTICTCVGVGVGRGGRGGPASLGMLNFAGGRKHL
jgi:hypothetical protein